MDLDRLTASLMLHEGSGPVVNGRLMPYKDTQGFMTIGFGRCIDKEGISHDEALNLLRHDIQDALTIAEGEPWWPLVANDDVRSRAMVELVFNLGIGTLRQFVHALFALGNGDFNGAASEFMDSAWAREVGQRAEILTQMIRTGQDP